MLLVSPMWACGGAAFGTQYHDGVQYGKPSTEPPEVSLIPTDAAALTDADIHKILRGQEDLIIERHSGEELEELINRTDAAGVDRAMKRNAEQFSAFLGEIPTRAPSPSEDVATE